MKKEICLLVVLVSLISQIASAQTSLLPLSKGDLQKNIGYSLYTKDKYNIGVVYNGEACFNCHLPIETTYGGLTMSSKISSTETNLGYNLNKLIAKDDISITGINFYVNQTYPGYVWVSDVTCKDVEYENKSTLKTCTDNGHQVQIERWHFVLNNSAPLQKDQLFIIDIVGSRSPTFEFRATDVIPRMLGFNMPELAWWNSSCNYRTQIISNISSYLTVSVQDTTCLSATQCLWANVSGSNSYVYSSGSGLTGLICGVGEQGFQNYWENSTIRSGNSSATGWIGDTGVLATWHCDEGTGSTCSDSSASGYTGTVTGATFQTGVFAKGLNFSEAGTNRMDVGVVAAQTTGSIVFDVLFYARDAQQFILSKDYSGANTGDFNFYLYQTKLYFQDKTGGDILISKPISASNTWFHVVFTWGASGQCNFYINGSLDSTVACPSGLSLFGSTGGDGHTQWGAISSSDASGFAGKLDEMRIYTRNLTASEVQQLYWETKNNMTSLGSEDQNANPIAFITSPTNTSYTSQTVLFNYTVIDPSSSSIVATHYINGTMFNNTTVTNNTWNNFNKILGDGIYNYTLQFGNSVKNQTSVYFTVDSSPPVVAIQLPSGNVTMALMATKQYNFNFTASDSISAISQCWYSLNGGANTSLPGCSNITISFTNAGWYTINLYSNNSLGLVGSASRTFYADMLNAIRVYDQAHPYTEFISFSVLLSNGTNSLYNSTSQNITYFLTSQVPYGSNIDVLLSGLGFNNSYQTIPVLNASSQFNLSFPAFASGLTIDGAFDEQTLASLCYNVTLVNETFSSYTAFACGPTFFAWDQVPQGDVVITFTNSSYLSRNYYATINPSVSTTIKAWLLQLGAGSYITTFVYSNQFPNGENNTLVSANRYLNGSWQVISQQKTDTQGKGYLYLYPYAMYQINAFKAPKNKTIDSYYPNPSFTLYIQFDDVSTLANLTWVFDTVSISYTPTYSYQSGVIPIRYQINASSSDLQYYSLYLYQAFGNGTQIQLYGNSVNTSSTGGTINVNLNTTGSDAATARFIALINFKRTGFDEWNATYSYYLTPFNVNGSLLGGAFGYPTNIIPRVLGNFTSGKLGPTSQYGIGLVVLFIAAVVGLAVGHQGIQSGIPSSLGGSLSFIGVLALFTVASNGILFPWSMLLLLGLAVFGINLARYIP